MVIGVYLAFYINDNAKLNQDKKESFLLMESLANELSEDLDAFTNYQIPENINHQENLSKLITALTNNNTDSINDYIDAIFRVENYVSTTSTYNSIKASGKFSLIENFEIRRDISDFYEGLAIESAKRSEYQVEFFKTELIPWVIRNIDLQEMRFMNENEKIVLKNKIIIYESLISQKVDSYKMIIQESKVLKEKIDSELKLNN
ncbi:MAG: hypothetical protein RLN90_12300 [Balneolaceae bacterium]